MLTILFNYGKSLPLVSTGGGGAAGGFGGGEHWYRGKYKGELRRAIRRALGELNDTKDRRKKKRVAKKIAIRLVLDAAFSVEVPRVGIPEIVPLELLRVELASVARSLKGFDAPRMIALLQAYEDEILRQERDEEDGITAILLLAT